MHIRQFCILLLAITSTTKAAVILKPDSDNLPMAIASPEDNSDTEIVNKDTNDWYFHPENTNFICHKQDAKNCHPVDFEPESDWKQILPLQMIPPGLDIKMNLETGLKEAKLRDLNSVVENNKGLETYKGEDVPETDNDIIHEFSDLFKNLEDGVNVEDSLETLIDFSHDYKHGFKIIHNEQSFIMNKIKSKDITDDIKDLYLRLITSCLRNNGPAKEVFFVKNVDYIIEQIPAWISTKKTQLLNRAVNILQNVAYKSSSNNDLIDNLELLYMSSENHTLKIKILEIFSDLELLITYLHEDPSQLNFHFDPSKKSLVKRNLDNYKNLESWFNEYAEKIQSDSLDEFYLQKFLKTMIEFKNNDPGLKPDQKFIEWIAQESMNRFKQLENANDAALETRDLEKESFSKELIRARHEVFGNKHAARTKMPLDEL